MTKAIFIILTLAGFASGAEFEVTDRLSVDGSSVFRNTVTINGLLTTSGSVGVGTNSVSGVRLAVIGSTDKAYSLAVGTSAAYNFVVSTMGNVGLGTTTPGSRFSVLGSTETAYVMTAGTSTAYSLTLSTSGNLQIGGNAQFSGTISRGTHTVLDDSMLDSFTLKLDTTTNKIKLADRIEQNIMLDAFKIAVSSSLSIFNMVDGIMDEFEDETGVDKIDSSSQTYNSAGHYYSPLVSMGGIDSNTKLAIHFNGADGASSYTAETGQTVTFVNHAKLTTAHKEFGSASLLLDGTDDYVSVPASNDWNFGSGDFTIDFWYSKVSDGAILTKGTAVYTPFVFLISGGVLTFYATSNNSSWDIASAASVGSVESGVFHHYAVVRNGGNWFTFKDGIQVTTWYTGTTAIIDSADILYIGRYYSAYFLGGYIDELRISKGLARWTTNFTPPTVEYSSTTSSYCMTLVSTVTAAMAVPSNARLVLFEEDVDTVTLNSELQAYVTGRDTTSWTQVLLADEGYYQSGRRILSGMAGIAAASTGTAMRWKVETHNNRNLKLHGVGLNWDQQR